MGASLRLFGSLVDLNDLTLPEQKPIRILGVGGKRQLTLDGCYHGQTTIKMPGIDIHNYRVSHVFSGACFDADGDLSFDEVSVSFDQLAHWVYKTGLSVEVGAAAS